MIHPSIKNISIFGSATRNDTDHLSDIDLLVLVEDHKGTVPVDEIFLLFSGEQQKKLSISWYGENKLKEMFANGHLFAWHLFLESTPLNQSVKISELLGKPSDYNTALVDIEGLIELLNSTRNELINKSPNIIYELGLIYLAARNIAMSASWHLLEKPEFGRYTPSIIKNPEFPINRNDYEVLMKCRMASQRGLCFYPTVNYAEAIEMCDKCIDWTDKIIREIINE